MKFINKDNANRIALEQGVEEEVDFDYDDDFQKKRAERQVWRPWDPYGDFP